jgi:hypothetical protein
VLDSVEVDQDLALQQIHALVCLRMQVERRHLASLQVVLEQQIAPVGLRSGSQPPVHPSP